MSYKKQPGGRMITVRVPATSRHKAFSYKKRSKSKRGKVILPATPEEHRGALQEFGYAIKNTELSRHLALGKAIKKYGAMTVFRMLMKQATLRKNFAPTTSAKFRADAEWAEGQAA